MATCTDCTHQYCCKYDRFFDQDSVENKCNYFKSTADVQEVKHGYWKQNQYHKNIYHCSKCGRHIEDRSDNPLEHFPYCHCGAKMNLEVEK